MKFKLIDNARVVIYYCNRFIIQATGVNLLKLSLSLMLQANMLFQPSLIFESIGRELTRSSFCPLSLCWRKKFNYIYVNYHWHNTFFFVIDFPYKLPNFIKYNVHTSIVRTWISQWFLAKNYFYFARIISQELIIASLFIIKAILNPFSATFHA